ncbi:unnamed protein product, partial [Discosporangium mesarthrocarpum]
LTVPAIWDDYAKNFMRQAAHKAGLVTSVDSPRLRLCLEPEAACLAVSTKECPKLCQVGTKFMIVDCGGGTVDITTHEVLGTSPLRLRELSPPTGGPWGSTLVDYQFELWLRDFLGAGSFEMVENTSVLFSTLLEWENHKMALSKEQSTVRLNLGNIADYLGLDYTALKDLRDRYNNDKDPDLQVRGAKRMVVLSPTLVASFFRPAIDHITTCLRTLQGGVRELDHAFLVGGFSNCVMLQEAVR